MGGIGTRVGLLAAILLAVTPCRARAAPDAERPPFRACEFGWIPWAATVEEAKARAKEEGRLVLAFAFAWDAKGFEAGYDGAAGVRASEPIPPAQAESALARDPGFVKEQAALAAWLGEPEVSALVARSFVPVRMRLHTWHFFEGGPGPFPDALKLLGTSDRETRPPAVVVATSEGKLVRRVERIGVFDARLLHRVLLAALRENPRARPPRPRPGTAFRAAVDELFAGGDVEEARKRLASPPADDAAWAKVALAHLDATEGKLDVALAALRALPASRDRDAALAEASLRRGDFEEAASLSKAAREPAARAVRAAALERLGRDDDATKTWQAVLDDVKDGPLAAKARLHLSLDGPRAREWDPCEDFGAGGDATTTVVGRGGEAAAVRYLLSQQDADGAWHDTRGAPGSAFDLAVPRTALCVCALKAWAAAGKADEKAVRDAIARGTEFVTKWSESPRDLVWPLTYALHLELELLAEKPTEAGRKRARGLLEALTRIEHGGGWTYTAPPRLHTFNTAPILLLLVKARELKLPVEAAQVERAARFLGANRVKGTRVFHYGPTMEPMSGEPGKTDAKSTAMRTPVCELALLAAGAEKGTKGVSEAVDLWFENQAAARGTQKIFESYVDVTSLQDSYRWFFGTWYAAQCVARLPDAKRKKAASRMDAVIRTEQEIDGSFVDSQMVGKSSSTALALLALAELRPSSR